MVVGEYLDSLEALCCSLFVALPKRVDEDLGVELLGHPVLAAHHGHQHELLGVVGEGGGEELLVGLVVMLEFGVGLRMI